MAKINLINNEGRIGTIEYYGNDYVTIDNSGFISGMKLGHMGQKVTLDGNNKGTVGPVSGGIFTDKWRITSAMIRSINPNVKYVPFSIFETPDLAAIAFGISYVDVAYSSLIYDKEMMAFIYSVEIGGVTFYTFGNPQVGMGRVTVPVLGIEIRPNVAFPIFLDTLGRILISSNNVQQVAMVHTHSRGSTGFSNEDMAYSRGEYPGSNGPMPVYRAGRKNRASGIEVHKYEPNNPQMTRQGVQIYV